MPSSTHPTSPSSPISPSSPSRWKERLRQRFRRRQYTSLNPEGSTPSPSSASAQTGSDSQHRSGDSSSRLEDDIWVDGDTLNSHQLPEPTESLPRELHIKEQGTDAGGLAQSCGEGAMKKEDQDQPHQPELFNHAPADAANSDGPEQESRSSNTSSTLPSIPSRTPYRCRICQVSYYARSQTRGLCYICASTLSV